uniref:RNase Phy3 n=1 Tax=Solanum tuberosum TaxID=4113 RepID=M1DQ85_SOLTU
MLENVFIHQEDMKVYAVMQVDHSLRDKLRTIWPNLKVGRSDEWLWMYERRQHGYSIESVLDVTGYFNAAKTINELMIDYLLTYLKDEEINPSESYEINKIKIGYNPSSSRLY